MSALKGLPPIIDRQSRVLILGSFPSVASLTAQQYYAHRQNLFWRIVGELTGHPLIELSYPEKRQAVLSAGIAIWDVYACCERQGSLDSAIRHGIANDFQALKRRAPQLKQVCFNGKSAGRFATNLQALGFETCVLPSTSPANASWSFERKLEAWRAGLAIGREIMP